MFEANSKYSKNSSIIAYFIIVIYIYGGGDRETLETDGLRKNYYHHRIACTMHYNNNIYYIIIFFTAFQRKSLQSSSAAVHCTLLSVYKKYNTRRYYIYTHLCSCTIPRWFDSSRGMCRLLLASRPRCLLQHSLQISVHYTHIVFSYDFNIVCGERAYRSRNDWIWLVQS